MARVYVIELDRAPGGAAIPADPLGLRRLQRPRTRDPLRPASRGYKSSGLVKRFALRLRPDLYDDLAPLEGGGRAGRRSCSGRANSRPAASSPTATAPPTARDEGGWNEWGAERLALVGDHVDGRSRSWLDSSFEALTPSRCAELLHGERGFWVADYIDQADPPPAYGRFAHVALDALTERAAATIGVSAPAV